MIVLSPAVLSPDAACALITAGILLLYLEANRPGRIVPGCTGLLLLMLGIWSLRTPPSLWVALTCAAILACLTGALWHVACTARRAKFTPGMAGLLHKPALTVTPLAPLGQVELAGEIWPATASTSLPAGAPVVVTRVHGRLLHVQAR